MRRSLAALALFAALTAGCGGAHGTKPAAGPVVLPYRGLLLQSPIATTDFGLRDQEGKLVRLSAFRPGYVILTFLYTQCPDVCPLIASQLNVALRRLGPNVHVLAVSVDPRRDTPAAVRRFVAARGLVARFRYLTGTRAQLSPVWTAYHVAVQPHGRTIDHSAFELLIDPSGRGRLIWDSRVKGPDVVHDVRVFERRNG